MGKKKLQTHREEPENKKHRTGDFASDLSTDEVEVFVEPRNTEGIVTTGSFTAKIGCQPIQQIKGRIERDDELDIGKTEKFYLYPAFKEALLRLLRKIEEALNDEHNSVRMILIHGVPNIGKTSLAKCLSYFLALSTGGKETVHYVKLSHSAKVDNSVITDFIATACNHNYLIVDQVNTHTLKCSEIVRCVENRLRVGRNRMPLVMFTSGHYTPSEEWLDLQKSRLLCYKLITMQVDVALVSKLKDLMVIPQGDVISNDDLLKVTTCYSRMNQCLNHLRFHDSSAREDALRDKIYPGADIQLIQGKSAIHFIWLAWQEILSRGLPSLDQFTEDDCKLNPHYVEYLGYLISGIKDTRDRGINAILNLMDITGHTQYERNGYREFKCDSYCYKFLHKVRLYEVLRCAVKIDKELSHEEKYHMMLSAFVQLTKEGDTQYQYLRGGLFELIINAICDKERDKREHPVGMVLIAAGLEFVKVDHCEAVATDLELCTLPLKYQTCKDNSVSFWCVLNVSGKPPFKGFDFAYMETSPEENKPVVEKLQLFQVTVNPEGKTYDAKLNMTDVLDKIKTELVNHKLIKHTDADKAVTPYFVHPSSENRQIVLPFRNSQRSIVVKVVGFPQTLLFLKGT